METLASRKKVMQQLNNLLHTMPALNIQVEIEFATPTRKQMEENLARHVFGNVVGEFEKDIIPGKTVRSIAQIIDFNLFL